MSDNIETLLRLISATESRDIALSNQGMHEGPSDLNIIEDEFEQALEVAIPALKSLLNKPEAEAAELAIAIGAHLERICLGHKPTREELNEAVQRGLVAHEHVFCPHCKPCRLAPTIAECEDAMRELASYISAGGYGSFKFEPKKLAQAIREGIDGAVRGAPPLPSDKLMGLVREMEERLRAESNNHFYEPASCVAKGIIADQLKALLSQEPSSGEALQKAIIDAVIEWCADAGVVVDAETVTEEWDVPHMVEVMMKHIAPLFASPVTGGDE